MRRITRRKRGSPRGFSLVELLVVIGIVALLISVMLPTLCASKERANRVKCASNLRQIGMGLRLYANDNKGQFPRTVMNTSGSKLVAFSRPDATDPFGVPRPDDNDVTAALFLLVRTCDLSPEVFTCPSGDAERAQLTVPATSRANFGSKRELSYGVAWPYVLKDMGQRGYMWKGGKFDAGFVIAADISPGIAGSPDSTIYAATSPGVPQSTLRRMSSLNHEREGQNCLFTDGHVEWFTTPFVGVNRDHIYTSQSAAGGGDPMMTPPRGPDDSVLVPTDD